MKTTNLRLRYSMPYSALQRGLAVIALLVICSGLAPAVHAVNPTPDGGYAGANTAEGGSGALFSLTTGTNNSALGSQALYTVTTGSQNTATGAQALRNNTADRNTADGFQALVNNTTGTGNTASGWRALFQNIMGARNTAIGYAALQRNRFTGDNTAVGYQAMYVSDGNGNTAVGSNALYHSGNDDNTALGAQALFNNNAGAFNIAVGLAAGFNITDGSANIDIGNAGVAGDSNTIRIGTVIFPPLAQTATYIAGIDGQTVDPASGTTVFVDGNGKLGTVVSSKRFKNEIKPMDKTSEAILCLQPVTFRYRKELDPEGVQQFGLVAEDVEKVNPDLVVRDKEGKPYTVRYEAVNAMLLNEFLKEHRKVEQLQATVTQLMEHLKEQDSRIEKISNEVEMSRSAPHVVANP